LVTVWFRALSVKNQHGLALESEPHQVHDRHDEHVPDDPEARPHPEAPGGAERLDRALREALGPRKIERAARGGSGLAQGARAVFCD
jgi:hypothetical protein